FRPSVRLWPPFSSSSSSSSNSSKHHPSLRCPETSSEFVKQQINTVRATVGVNIPLIPLLSHPGFGAPRPGREHNHQVCWDQFLGIIQVSSIVFVLKIIFYNLLSNFSGSNDGRATGDRCGIKWLKCPTGASFGFGGKLVSFHPVAPTQGAQTSTSEVHVHNLVIEQSLVSRSTEFEAAIQNGDKSSLRALCEKKSQESLTRILQGQNCLLILASKPPQAPPASSTDELSQTLADTLNIDHVAVTDNADAQFLIDNGDDFFNNPQSSEASLAEESVSTNGQQIEQEVSGDAVPSDPSIDKSIQHALVVRDYKGAVNQCLASNRMADALVIAHAGGSALWENTRNHYLKNSISPYLK
ncbi:hypothetical protein ACJX0J_024958, partial [Zea mays]